MKVYTVVVKFNDDEAVITRNYLSSIKNGKKFIEKVCEVEKNVEKIAIFETHEVKTTTDIKEYDLAVMIIQ